MEKFWSEIMKVKQPFLNNQFSTILFKILIKWNIVETLLLLFSCVRMAPWTQSDNWKCFKRKFEMQISINMGASWGVIGHNIGRNRIHHDQWLGWLGSNLFISFQILLLQFKYLMFLNKCIQFDFMKYWSNLLFSYRLAP